jgi:hypothetical protein
MRKGEKVHWNTSQGTTTGKLIERRTEDFRFDGQQFSPTDDDTYWIVESEKTGARAAHKESALTKA